MGTNWSLRLVNTEFEPMEPVQALVQQVLDARFSLSSRRDDLYSARCMVMWGMPASS